MTVSKAKTTIPYSEFLKWIEYEDREWMHQTKLDQYIANLTFEFFLLRYEVENLLTPLNKRVPHNLKPESFLLKFKPKNAPEEKVEVVQKHTSPELTDEQVREKKILYTKMAKSKWLPFVFGKK